ncbi:hypothetical protein E4L95_08045 [Paracoccus liaowanqingii]|uniref:Uncharacterized protein n=1 Tax=Paracoccus liaowanqingii TaxID=2560053 RepID=A0A4Z1C4N5_9RHOB|nr:hypothetical protein [Paracoccus liaowanqingii]TGN62061.1 hypothetical protein E4L95_08045 [Paracoccus liaowanqingii]
MKWSHAVESKILEIVEDAAPNAVHFYIYADKKRFVWNNLNIGDKSAVSRFEIPAVDVQYYLKTLKKAGYLDASILGNGDITYVSLALSGHDRIEQLRRMTLQASVPHLTHASHRDAATLPCTWSERLLTHSRQGIHCQAGNTRSGRAVAAILKLTVLSVGLPIVTSVLTFLVMRSLGE